MANFRISPPPTANEDKGIWAVWYTQVKDVINRIGESFSWTLLNFTGSNLTDIETRNHNDLNNSQGGGVGEKYHLTSAQNTSVGYLSTVTSDVQTQLNSKVAKTDLVVFSAYPSAATSLTATTYVKVTLGNEVFDTASTFDTTNSKFLPTTAGYYQINFGVSGATNTLRLFATLYKNGTAYSRGNDVETGAGAVWVSIGSTILYMNGSTDYLELYGWSNSTINTDTTAERTYMNGSLLWAA